VTQSRALSDRAVDVPAEGVSASRWQTIALAVAGVELAVLYAPTVAWLWGRWTRSVWDNAHGMFIFPLVAYLAYQDLKPLAGRPASSSRLGWGFVAVALVVQMLDAGMHTELLAACSLLLLLPGLSLLLLGVERTRAIAFPLAFTVFALPIPLSFTEAIHWQLRLIVIQGIDIIVPMLGVPVFTQGTEVHLPRGVLIVADACSGFSTLYATMAVACLVAYSANGRVRQLVVLLAAAPIAIAANVLRVSILVLLTQWRGPGILETPIHPISGLLTFALALPIILWLGGDGRAREPKPAPVV
jgi:exosortase